LWNTHSNWAARVANTGGEVEEAAIVSYVLR
jgi:hypothetical protein